ncbi:MAG: circadian clock KaiB family protein [Methanomassiliicoccales archaeon]
MCDKDCEKIDEKNTMYVLRLYVTGTTPRSQEAIRNIRTICEEELKGRYDLEVIDVYQQPMLAKLEQILAVPTLIRKLPLPSRKLVGDMSDKEKVVIGLEIRSEKRVKKE